MSKKVEKQVDLNSLAAGFLREREIAYAPPISRRLIRAVRSEMVKGVRAGERITDMVGRVRKVLDDQAPFRALKIVRTEVAGAFNRGNLEGFKQEPAVVRMKEWLTSRDGNVRPTQAGDFNHQTADGQRQPLTETFLVSGEQLMHPGDPNGSPGNIINCRCTMTPVTNRQVEAAPPSPVAEPVVPITPRPAKPRVARPAPRRRRPRVQAPAPRPVPVVAPRPVTPPVGPAPSPVVAPTLNLEPATIPKGARPGDFITPQGKIVRQPRRFFRGQEGAVVRLNENGMLTLTEARSEAELFRAAAIESGKQGRLITADVRRLNNPLRVNAEQFADLSVAPKATIEAIRTAGHDGIIAKDVGIAVFDVSQLTNTAVVFEGGAGAAQLLAPTAELRLPKVPGAARAKRRQAERSLLSQAPVSSEPLGGGANISEVVTLKDGRKGVWKPAFGEMELRTAVETGTYYKREAATWDVAKIVGMDDLVPPTIVREVKGKLGSLQDFVPEAQIASRVGRASGPFPTSRRPQVNPKMFDGTKDFRRAATFDFLIGNSDRHGGNWMLTKAKNKMQLIDNGLSFPSTNRTFDNFANARLINRAIKERVGFDLKLLTAMDRNFPKIATALRKQGLKPSEIKAMRERIDLMLNSADWAELRTQVNTLIGDEVL